LWALFVDHETINCVVGLIGLGSVIGREHEVIDCRARYTYVEYDGWWQGGYTETKREADQELGFEYFWWVAIQADLVNNSCILSMC
jgi:hypothetical protein